MNPSEVKDKINCHCCTDCHGWRERLICDDKHCTDAQSSKFKLILLCSFQSLALTIAGTEKPCRPCPSIMSQTLLCFHFLVLIGFEGQMLFIIIASESSLVNIPSRGEQNCKIAQKNHVTRVKTVDSLRRQELEPLACTCNGKRLEVAVKSLAF